MMTESETISAGLQVVVGRPAAGLCVVTVAGVLDAAGVARLTRVIEGQLALAASGDRATSHVVVDLSGIGAFVPGALDGLGPVRARCERAAVGLYLAGCQGRVMLLPLGAQRAWAEFDSFPTIEAAVAVLSAGGMTGAPRPGVPRPGPGPAAGRSPTVSS